MPAADVLGRQAGRPGRFNPPETNITTLNLMVAVDKSPLKSKRAIDQIEAHPSVPPTNRRRQWRFPLQLAMLDGCIEIRQGCEPATTTREKGLPARP